MRRYITQLLICLTLFACSTTPEQETLGPDKPSAASPGQFSTAPGQESALGKANPAQQQGAGQEAKNTRSSSDLKPLPIVKRFPRAPIIVIDPGHGGEEEGAKGFDGVLEKDVVLNISLKLERLLRGKLRAHTVLTRSSDITLSLADRTALANVENADLFVSIHANASPKRNQKGIETYYLDNTDDKSSLRLAERENASMLLQEGSSDLGFIVSDLIQNAKLEDSISLAHNIQRELYRKVAKSYSGVVNLGVKKAPFYVLVGAHMPCVLVEVSFIDHDVEGRRLAKDEYQDLVARAILSGVTRYLVSQWKL